MCNVLTIGLNPTCKALKKPGGVSKRVWVGLLDDLASASFATDGISRVLLLTFKATKGFVQVIGKREKHNGTMGVELSENRVLRNHTGNLILFYNTPEALGAIEKLVDAEGVFMVFETKAGQLEVWGLNKSANFQDFGLKTASLEGGTGTVLTDNNNYTLGMSGLHENLELYYQPADVAVAITGLTSANPAVITMASTTAFNVGDIITFNALNGNQQIGGQSINGQSVEVLSKTATTLTVNANVTGVTPATTGSVSKVSDLATSITLLNAQTIFPSVPI
jgi:hypothetical protein